ncbi:MAG: ATP-binding protein [Phenylobacterium sp.]
MNISETGPQFKFFHEVAADVYSRVGRYDLALQHHRAFKRLDDEAKELMVNTNSALMAAQFDFANQDLRIARLQAEKLRKDTELAESRNRITLILLGGSVLFGGLLGYNFLSLRRSSRRIDATNTRLNLANESLERALKAKSEFLATTSHEIRTPLNGILGVTQVLLADDKVSPDVRDRVRLMHGAGETMRALVNDILDAAKIESGTLIINKGEAELCELLEDAARLWSDRAEEKGLKLIIDRSGAPPKILEDGSRLRQILFNLLSNAIKFTDAGSVTLTAACETLEAGERLIITVADTGIGIPPDRIEDIFESFQQVDGGVTRRFGGTGLGLSISRSLAEAMGGSLGVDSVLGQGSVFTLVLPLVRPQAALQAGEAASGGPAFLIIEANPLTRSLLRAAVAPVGLEVEFAADLDAAVQRLSAGGVEAALVDAAMLGTDEQSRLTALAGLAATGGGRIAVTWPSPDPDVTSRILAAGAAQVISKPISASALGAALCEGRAARA